MIVVLFRIVSVGSSTYFHVMKNLMRLSQECLQLFQIRCASNCKKAFVFTLLKNNICHFCGQSMRISLCHSEMALGTITRRHQSSYIEYDSTFRDYDDINKTDILKAIRFNPVVENVFLVQPITNDVPSNLTSPDLELAESIALVESLPKWKVVGHCMDPKKSKSPLLFDEETIDRIKRKIRILSHITCIFVSVEQLNPSQRIAFRNLFGVDKIYDRYTLVLQIFKLRAQTKAAKLQVALAEIPYARNHLIHGIESGETPQRQKQGFVAESYQNQIKNLFHQKEKKLRKELQKLAQNRDLHRQSREKHSLPVVAVVGYTNAGKTSLIKALTKAEKMEPKDLLFATLDVTAHAALFPNKLKYLLVDTVGFLSNLPLELFDAFSATMEDMLCADVIIHVRDASHPDRSNQLTNVLSILSKLKLKNNLMKNIVEVRNKIDLADDSEEAKNTPTVVWPKQRKIMLKPGQRDMRPAVVCRVSATRGTGLADLVDVLQNVVMILTARKRVEMLVPASGTHLNWLQENCCVEEMTGEGDYQLRLIAIVTDAQMNKFLHNFEDIKVLREFKDKIKL